jgi:hypothetical protein
MEDDIVVLGNGSQQRNRQKVEQLTCLRRRLTPRRALLSIRPGGGRPIASVIPITLSASRIAVALGFVTTMTWLAGATALRNPRPMPDGESISV